MLLTIEVVCMVMCVEWMRCGYQGCYMNRSWQGEGIENDRRPPGSRIYSRYWRNLELEQMTYMLETTGGKLKDKMNCCYL